MISMVTRSGFLADRGKDDIFNYLTRNPAELQAVMRGMGRGTAGAYWPNTPAREVPHRSRRPIRRLPVRQRHSKRYEFAYSTPVTHNPGDVVSSTDWDTNTVNDILYLLSGQPLVSLFYQPNANYTLSLVAGQGSFSKVEGAGTNNLRNTLTLNGSRIMGYYQCFFGVDDANHDTDAELSILLDGTTATFNNTHYTAWKQGFQGSQPISASLIVPYFFTGLATGAHTLDPAWRSDWTGTGGHTTVLTMYSETNYGGIAHLTWEI